MRIVKEGIVKNYIVIAGLDIEADNTIQFEQSLEHFIDKGAEKKS